MDNTHHARMWKVIEALRVGGAFSKLSFTDQASLLVTDKHFRSCALSELRKETTKDVTEVSHLSVAC